MGKSREVVRVKSSREEWRRSEFRKRRLQVQSSDFGRTLIALLFRISAATKRFSESAERASETGFATLESPSDLDGSLPYFSSSSSCALR